jgi:hypothetical protein
LREVGREGRGGGASDLMKREGRREGRRKGREEEHQPSKHKSDE